MGLSSPKVIREKKKVHLLIFVGNHLYVFLLTSLDHITGSFELFPPCGGVFLGRTVERFCYVDFTLTGDVVFL